MTTSDYREATFGRYGVLAIGDAKYAQITPHHAPHPHIDGVYDGGYVNTFDPAREALLCRIFDDRDAEASATVALRWRGNDGESGATYLLRDRCGVTEEILISDECVDTFEADITEANGDEIIQTDFRATVRG